MVKALFYGLATAAVVFAVPMMGYTGSPPSYDVGLGFTCVVITAFVLAAAGMELVAHEHRSGTFGPGAWLLATGVMLCGQLIVLLFLSRGACISIILVDMAPVALLGGISVATAVLELS